MRPTTRFFLIVAAAVVLFSCANAAPKSTVMILDGQNNHNWKGTTPVMTSILEKSGLFTVTVVTSPPKGQDMSGFKPTFGDYDAILLNYNGADWPEETRRAFVDYVKGGGGVVVVHAADNSFGKWQEYNEIIGLGGWGGRTEKDGPYIRYRDGKIVRDMSPGRGGSHGSQHEYVVVTREPFHPVTFGMPVAWKHVKDELYDRLRGPAKHLTVLATAFSDPKTRGTGEHEPALFTIDYGTGRVFHTILGDNPRPMQDGLGFKVTLIRGTEWAATGLVTAPVPAEFAILDAKKAGGGWVPLFDGTTLTGWAQKNGTAKYRVEKGTIIGTTNEGSPNSFLASTEDYGDFELTFEVKVDDQLNSGVQIRSVSTPDIKPGRVHGPQVEIATNGTAGNVYGEALGTGWLNKDPASPAAKAAFKRGEWNRYHVKAVGTSIKTWVNGVPVTDFVDETSKMPTGFIGLQVHGIKRGTGPYKVAWRNLYLKDLTKK